MIRHCVFVRFRQEISPAEKKSVFDDIVALKQHVPGLIAVHVGENVSPETGMDKGFSDGFICDFDGPSSRDAYLVHPEHGRAGARLVSVAEDGVAGILVFDIDVPS